MARKFQYADIGSISSGTMLEEDLIPAFTDELERLALANHNRQHLVKVAELRGEMDKPGYYDTDEASFDLNETLFDALNEYALPYFYFGAHPGNGADYGFWLTEDFEELITENGGLRVSDISEIPRGFTGEVLYVNDHGNCTLFRVVRGRRYETWSVV